MPAVTIDQVEALIHSEHYHTAFEGRAGAIEFGDYVGREQPAPNDADLEPLKKVTICTLVDKHGYVFVGVNTGPVIPSEFCAETGRNMAREAALDQVWAALGYKAHCKTHEVK